MSMIPENPLAGRLTCTIAEAKRATGLERTTIWRLRRDGVLKTIPVRGRKLIDVESLFKLLTPDSEATA